MSWVTSTTTTPPMTVVCCIYHYHCYNGSHLCGPNSIRSSWCGSAAKIDLAGHNKGSCWHHHCATATTTAVRHTFSDVCLLCHGSSTGESSVSELSFPLIHYVGVCYSVCFLLLGSNVAAMFTNGAQPMGFAPLQSFRAYLGEHMCLLVMVCCPYQKCTEWLLLPLLWVGGSFMLVIPQLFNQYGGAYSF